MPPIRTINVSGHLAGQNTKGPLRYMVFSDSYGPVGVLWKSMTPNEESVGWEPNRSHPTANKVKEQWRIRITEAQARDASPYYDPKVDGHYSAESFFDHWTTNVSHDGFILDGPYDFTGGAASLASHLGWS